MMSDSLLLSAPRSTRFTKRCSLLLHAIVALAWWLGMLAPCGLQPLRADNAKSTDRPAPPLVYRRIFVPAENIEAWPRDGEKYIPIEARDFDAWIESANRAANQRDKPAIIREAEYSARLEGNRLVEGRGQWSIDIRGDGPAFLPLRDLSFTVREPRWQDAPQQPARIGAWGRSDRLTNTVGLEVPRSGILEFAWHAQARSIPDGIEVPWRLPTSNATKVILDLPEGKQPHIERSIVVASRQLPTDSAEGSGRRRRWELVVGPSSAKTLRITAAGGSLAENSPTLSMRDDVNYRVTQRGLDIVATWILDASMGPERELAVPLPEGVHLVSVLADGRDLAWRASKKDGSSAQTALIELPDVKTPSGLRINLRAWHPLVLDRPWRLPTLKPEGLYWTSGNVELSIAADLEMCDLAAKDCLQTGVSQAPTNATATETYWLSAYSPEAEVEVTLARRQADATVRLGSSLALAEPEVNGRLVTQWDVADGNVHSFSGELAAGWIVETVETVPADVLSEWFIDRRDGRNQIEIQLSRVATPTRDISVIVTGRLQRLGLGDSISANSMRMVSWRGARVERHLLTFQTVEPYAFEPAGELPIIARKTIDDDDRALLAPDGVEGTVFDLTRADHRAALTLTMERGEFEADIWLDATFSRAELRQTQHLVIRPNANRVERLLIYATAPLGDGVQWMEESSNMPLSAERLAIDDPRRAGLPADGELWLVRLPRPTSESVEVIATLTTPWLKRKQVPLLSMPDAVEQRGRVLVHGEINGLPKIDSKGMRAIPLPVASDESPVAKGSPPVRAAYRFEPANCLTGMPPTELWVSPATANGISPHLVRHLDLQSYFWSSGRATHLATYELLNDGATSFDLQLPTDATLKTVSIDGRTIDIHLDLAPEKPFPIPLPPRARSATVAVYFDMQQAPLSNGSALLPPLVQHDLPLSVGHWTIWLPEEFSASGANLSAGEQYLNWRQRLFGPLSRPAGSQTFDPLRAADWSRLINSVAGLWSTINKAAPIQTARPSPDITFEKAQRSLLGWRAFHTSFLADAPASVVVAHPPAMTAWAAAGFLLCLVGGGWLRAQSGELFVVLVAIAAGLSLLLPAVFAPLATGVLLGLLFSLIAVWPRRSTAGHHSPHSWSRLSTVGAVAVALGVGLATLTSAQPAGETASSDKSSHSAAIHRLLIPVSADGHQAGSKYYVSEEFLRNLLRAASDQASTSGQWVLKDVSYMGELREREEPTGIVAGDWTMTFSLDVLARDTTIVLPLVRDEAKWPKTGTLDGVPVPLVWREDGRSCAVEISEPGQYSLVITCVPHTADAEGRNSVRLTIPPIAGARFDLDYPTAVTGLIVAGSEVVGSENQVPGSPEFVLDGTGTIVVQWPRLEALPAGAQALRVSGLRWLRIGANGVELDTRFVVEGNARRPEALRVAFDRRWELVQDENPQLDWRLEEEPGNRVTVRVPLPPDDIDRQEVTLRWRLVDAPSLGRVQLPPIELISIPVTQRWLAISTDPALECEIVEGSASAGTVNEFLAMWGDTDVANEPQLVLGNIESPGTWSIAIRPRLIESAIDEVLHLAAGIDSLRVLYQADVVPGKTNEYQFQLIVPADLAIDEIAVTQVGRQIPVRWAQAAENRINVFFSEELADEYRLVLTGSVPIDEDGTRALPHLAAAGIDTASQSVQLYREAEVLVEVRGLAEVDQLPDGPLEPPPATWTAKSVGAFRTNALAADNARLVITDNDLEMAGQTLTTLTHEADAWWASFTCRFLVEQGQLSTLRLRVPATWVGPFTIESSVPASVEMASQDKMEAILLVHFAKSIATGNPLEMSLRGPLTVAAPSIVSAPEIVVESPSRGPRYLLVPTSLDAQPLAWTEVGVRLAKLPGDLQPRASVAGRSFEIVAAPFRVALQQLVAPQPTARVRLADATVAIGALGGELVVTRLVVGAPDLAECILQLPSDQQLVTIRLDGQPAPIQKTGAAEWQLQLGPTPLPRLLEIVSRSSGPSPSSSRRELRRPVLLANGEPIPVEVSLWSIGHLSTTALPRIEGAAAVNEVEQAALRMDRLVSIAEAAMSAAIESPLPDGYNWFRPWAAMLTAVQQESLEAMSRSIDRRTVSQVPPPSEDQLARASERLDEWIEQCSEILIGPDLGDLLEASASGEPSPIGPPGRQIVEDWTFCVAEGGSDRLTMVLVPASARSRQIQVIGVLAIVGLAAASLALMRQPAIWDLLYRWPHAFGFLLGLAYWAWLWPSWLGLLIAAGSVLLAWRTGWPGPSLRLEGSTVLRAGRPT